MAVLSCLNYKTIPTTCVEYVHPWTDSCTDATLGLLFHSFKYSLRTYATLYLFTALMRRKKPSKKVVKDTLTAILQSTVFLTTHAYGFAVCLCTIRRIFGTFNVLSVSFTPAFLSSLVAINLERPSRRPILCLYVTNIATETLFRMAVDRGWVRPVRHGELAIFTLSAACLLYHFRGAHSDDSIFSLIKFVVGDSEECLPKSLPKDEPSQDEFVPVASTSKGPEPTRAARRHSSMFHIISEALKMYRRIINWLKSHTKAACCPHDNGCLYYTLQGGCKMLGVGYAVQVLLRTVLSLPKIFRRPSILPSIFFNKKVLNLGSFLSLFTMTFRATSCLLRRARGKDDKLHALPAGLLAGLAFYFYPDNTVALYVMWKAIQVVYESCDVEIPYGLQMLYSASCGVLFHAAILEPNCIRPAYVRFLNGISGQRFVAMDRLSMKPLGFDVYDTLQAIVYCRLVDAGYIPDIPNGTVLLYCFSTAVLFHACFVEPKTLRSNYMQFLNGLSGGRCVAMARKPIDNFGYDTSRHLAEVLTKLNINQNPKYSFQLIGNPYPRLN